MATRTDSLIEWGVAAAGITPGAPPGDLHVVAPFPGGVLVAVLDGLGHGPEARAAAERGTEALHASPADPPAELIRACHRRLRGTRGAAVSLASFDAHRSTMTWLGVGNVEGVLLRADGRAGLVLRGGVVGYRLPPLVEKAEPVSRGDTLVLCTDGIERRAAREVEPDRPPQRVAESLLARRAGGDDALALAIRYLGAAG